MNPDVSEWMHLLFRWMHIIAAIMWIGSSIFFVWLDTHLEKPSAEKAKKGIEGVLWMVHSGGFYEVEKKLVAPGELPPKLHWFKWEAAFTWISGFFLLGMLYYDGGALLMHDESIKLSSGAQIGIGIGTLAVTWAIYDVLWNTVGKSANGLAIALTALLIVGAAYLLQKTMSGRAAYMHVGAMIGTWMVANVWMRIIPAQRGLVEAVRAGKKPDETLALRAKQRSRQNSYFTYPVIFVMISNHFPNTYGMTTAHGTKIAWLLLALFFFVGAAVRHYQIVYEGSPKVVFAGLAVAILTGGAASSVLNKRAKENPNDVDTTTGYAPPTTATMANTAGGPTNAPPTVDPATVGVIKGVVHFEGTPPPPKELTIPASCEHKGPTFEKVVAVTNGMLADAFVYIKEGMADWPEPASTTPVVLDQSGCMYSPRVIGVQLGQAVTFVNSDPVMHNIHGMGDANGFNAGMPGKDQRITRKFESPEVMLKMKCDVHPWMTAYIGVVPHPYFAVTGANGEFSLENVPPGDYVIEAWHEVLGTQTAKVTVTPKGEAKTDFTFKG